MLLLISSTVVALFLIAIAAGVLFGPRKALSLLNAPTQPPGAMRIAQVTTAVIALGLACALFGTRFMELGYANSTRLIVTVLLFSFGLSRLLAYLREPKPRKRFPTVPFIAAMFAMALFAQFR